MKIALIAAASLAAIAAVVPAAAPTAAWAQDVQTDQLGPYVNLNLGMADAGQADVKIIQGRAGYRFHPNFGVEGELATGIESDTDTIAGVRVKQTLKHEAAAYAVGFLPLGPNTDLLARVGYGTTKFKAKAAGISDSESEESWNFGVGAQHHFDGMNGVRADYTRQEFRHGPADADVWTVGYTRRF